MTYVNKEAELIRGNMLKNNSCKTDQGKTANKEVALVLFYLEAELSLLTSRIKLLVLAFCQNKQLFVCKFFLLPRGHQL